MYMYNVYIYVCMYIYIYIYIYIFIYIMYNAYMKFIQTKNETYFGNFRVIKKESLVNDSSIFHHRSMNYTPITKITTPV